LRNGIRNWTLMFGIMLLSRYVGASLRTSYVSVAYMERYYVLCDNLKWVSNYMLKLHISTASTSFVYRNCDGASSNGMKGFSDYYVLQNDFFFSLLLNIIAKKWLLLLTSLMIILFDEIWFYFPFIFLSIIFKFIQDCITETRSYGKSIIPNINAARYQFYYNKE